ncbi:IS1182-like element IS1182 family transposase [Lachnoanaerobaculum sp. JCM 36186]|uniref:IS1182 family transposase n=2 Tax=Lachnoanaerobaculum sanguinis TaxID=3065809 RepID=UPI00275ADDA4|nr:IS1182 family transposase [Lachnoanaerobaculum sp. JCM 36186]GMO02666.1 IS1182-like element IS1182 family transposase [Lachnoanaerobaculum sp. JCM 36186]
MLTVNYYNDFFEIGQQKINFSFYELSLPDDDPVYTLKKVMEDLDFSGLLANCSDKGRTGYNPIMMYAVITYANMRGIRSIDRIVDLCERDIAFIWLTQGRKPKRDAFYDFKGKKLTSDILDDLNYQFMRRLKKEGFVTLKELFIDGTKIEANANRYTFVWRGSINYHLAGLLDSIDKLYSDYNSFLQDNGFGEKYELGNAQMFVIDGIDKVRDIIEKNRKRKITKHKKLSNNRIIEIDNCSPIEILKLQKNLMVIADGEGIVFVNGNGKRKPKLQQLYEELEHCGQRLMHYKECFEIMGKDRNSYSKTDLEATFMRMKEDHMLNGQLKPAYNVQIAVENYFIVHGYVSNDRTDYNTLIPVLEKHKKAFGEVLEEVTADSGYCSEKNLLYLKENQIDSYIKLQDHEKRKTRAYSKDIGKYYNMKTTVFEDEQVYICHDGRELRHINTEKKEQNGYTQTYEVYGCSDCSGCEHKSKCLYKYNPDKDIDKNKVMKINEVWEELREKSHANIQSEKGILKRQIRSIQTEGHFGDIKENEDFRRFNYRTSDKVYKEFMLFAIGRNINKYHRFLYAKLKKFEGKLQEKTA